MKKWTKKQKWIVGVLAVLVVGGIGGKVYADSMRQRKLDEVRASLVKKEDRIQEIGREIIHLRDQENVTFLNEKISDKDVKLVKNKIQEIHKNYQHVDLPKEDVQLRDTNRSLDAIDKLANSLEFQFKIQNQLNQLFMDGTAIKGHEVNRNLAIKDDLQVKEVDQLSSLLKEDKNVKLLPVTDKKESWLLASNELLDLAKKQVEEIQTLNKAVDGFYGKDKAPNANTDKAKLAEISKKVEKVKNKKAREALQARLKPVTDAVNKQAEEKAKTGDQANNVATNNAVASNNNNQAAATTDDNTQDYSDNGGQAYSGGGGGNGGNYSGSNQGQGSANNYNPPASSNNGGNSGSSVLPPGYDGHATQEELDQQEIDAQDDDWSGFFN